MRAVFLVLLAVAFATPASTPPPGPKPALCVLDGCQVWSHRYKAGCSPTYIRAWVIKEPKDGKCKCDDTNHCVKEHVCEFQMQFNVALGTSVKCVCKLLPPVGTTPPWSPLWSCSLATSSHWNRTDFLTVNDCGETDAVNFRLYKSGCTTPPPSLPPSSELLCRFTAQAGCELCSIVGWDDCPGSTKGWTPK